jgi:hypothetical protein
MLTIDKSHFSSVPLQEEQITDNSTLGNSPETPISQIPSLPMNNKSTLLSATPDNKCLVSLPPILEGIGAMLVDINIGKSSSLINESYISLLNLDDTLMTTLPEVVAFFNKQNKLIPFVAPQ